MMLGSAMTSLIDEQVAGPWCRCVTPESCTVQSASSWHLRTAGAIAHSAVHGRRPQRPGRARLLIAMSGAP